MLAPDVAAPLCWGVFAAKPPSVARLELSGTRDVFKIKIYTSDT